MLTKKEYQMLELYSFISAISFTFPFTFNRTKFNKLTIISSIWLKCASGFSICLTAFHVGFLGIRLIPGYGYTQAELKPLHYSFILHILFLVAFFTTLMIQLEGILNANNLASVVNQLFHFNSIYGKRYFGLEFPKPSTREKIIWFLAIYIAMIAVVLIIFCILKPKLKCYLFSAVPQQWSSGWVFALCLFIESYTMLKALMINWYVFVVGYTYITTTKFWLKQVLSSEDEQNQRLQLEFDSDVLPLYRSLTLLNTLYNNGFASTFFPTLKSCVEFLAIFCLFGMLRYYHTTELWVYLFFPNAGLIFVSQLMGTIILMAHVSELSLEFKAVFINGPKSGLESTRPLFKRMIKSCKPLYCRVGLLFFIEKNTKLAYMALFLDWFITILLAIP